MNVPNVVKVRCHYCSRQLPIWRIHRLGHNAQLICDHCLDWHVKASEFLAGGAMPGCQACGATWETLRDRQPADVEVRLYVVPCSGVLAVFCVACLPAYVSKRRDLYGGTPFGTYSLNL